MKEGSYSGILSGLMAREIALSQGRPTNKVLVNLVCTVEKHNSQLQNGLSHSVGKNKVIGFSQNLTVYKLSPSLRFGCQFPEVMVKA